MVGLNRIFAWGLTDLAFDPWHSGMLVPNEENQPRCGLSSDPLAKSITCGLNGKALRELDGWACHVSTPVFLLKPKEATLHKPGVTLPGN